MKTIRKTAGILLAIVMLCSMMSVFASAETTYTITINNDADGHEYQAYQIFKGDLSDGILSNIHWGEGVATHNTTDSAATVAEKLDESYVGEDALDLEDLFAMITLSNVYAKSEQGEGVYVIDGLEAGYYLVKDKDGSLEGADDSYTEYIVKVVGNVETNPKSDVPSVEKKVKDINDSTETEMSAWQDSADHDFGDDVPFQLKATLANNVEAYDSYKVVFHDTLSAGLTFTASSVKVYLGSTDVTDYFTVEENNGNITFACDDVKAFGATNSSIITVEYTAVLNENANLGSLGNPNEVYLEYSNNPNWVGEGEEDDSPTGETSKDVVIVFTYKTVVNKVDEDGNALTGAEFVLEKFNVTTNVWEPIATKKNDEGTTFTFEGLDDGNYRLTETVTPTSYNSIDPIEFTVTAEHDVLSDSPALTSLSGNATTGEAVFTADLTAGSLSTDIVNNSGSKLPETGGIGTTIFYIVGAVLVIAAIVLLVAKKRMKSEG